MAAVSVSATIFIDILEIDGLSVNGLNANQPMALGLVGDPLSTTGLSYFSASGTSTEEWIGILDVDLDQILADNAANGDVTRLRMSFDITLTAFASSGATARIEMREFDGPYVPEPATVVLLGLGLGGLAMFRPRVSDSTRAIARIGVLWTGRGC